MESCVRFTAMGAATGAGGTEGKSNLPFKISTTPSIAAENSGFTRTHPASILMYSAGGERVEAWRARTNKPCDRFRFRLCGKGKSAVSAGDGKFRAGLQQREG